MLSHMADIYRIKSIWTGMPGAPGVSVMYANSAPSAATLTGVKTFWGAVSGSLPSTLTISVPGTGDIIDEATGDLTGTWSTTAPATTIGASAADYSAPSGSLVHWATSGVVAGRRVRGTTYIVPTVAQYESNGTLKSAWITTVQTAASALVSAFAGTMVVYARKFDPPAGSDKPARVGSSHVVTGNSVPDKAVVLRSRRD